MSEYIEAICIALCESKNYRIDESDLNMLDSYYKNFNDEVLLQPFWRFGIDILKNVRYRFSKLELLILKMIISTPTDILVLNGIFNNSFKAHTFLIELAVFKNYDYEYTISGFNILLFTILNGFDGDNWDLLPDFQELAPLKVSRVTLWHMKKTCAILEKWIDNSVNRIVRSDDANRVELARIIGIEDRFKLIRGMAITPLISLSDLEFIFKYGELKSPKASKNDKVEKLLFLYQNML